MSAHILSKTVLLSTNPSQSTPVAGSRTEGHPGVLVLANGGCGNVHFGDGRLDFRALHRCLHRVASGVQIADFDDVGQRAHEILIPRCIHVELGFRDVFALGTVIRLEVNEANDAGVLLRDEVNATVNEQPVLR